MAHCQKVFLQGLSYLFWWIIFLTIGPIIVLIFGLLSIWKFAIVEPIAKLCISKTIQRLNAFDSILATDSFWTNPLATIGLVLVTDGKVDITEFHQHFQRTVLDAKTEDGRSIYKKLLTVPTEFCGYYFRKPCQTFLLEDHIKEVQVSGLDRNSWEQTLHLFCSSHIKLPFANEKPLWDVTILNHSSSQSALFLRFHHSIADGYTVIKLVDRLTGIKTTAGNSGKSSTGNPIRKSIGNVIDSLIPNKVLSFLKAPSVIAHIYLDNLFHSNVFTRRKVTSEFLVSWTSVSLDNLRTVRQRSNTRFFSLGISLLCGALKKHLHFNEILSHTNASGFGNVRVMVPLPWPNHPIHKMTNHWTMGILESSVSVEPWQRLQDTDSSFSTMLASGSPNWCRFICPQLLTLLPKPLLKHFLDSNHIGNGIIFTSVPGSSEKGTVELLGHKVTSIFPTIGPQYSQTGIVCVIFTYNGQANCSVVGNLNLVQSQNNLNQICEKFLHEELESLLTDVCQESISDCAMDEQSIQLIHETI